MSPRIALFGAAGAIGQSIARALQPRGEPYRVVGRSAAKLATVFGTDPLAEICTWDPDNPASVRAACAGIDTLIHLVGVDYWRFGLHPELMRQTLDGASAAGVRHVLLIGTVYPYGIPVTTPVREDHPRQPVSFKGRMRMAQEDVLMAADRDGRVKATILRLPDFYGPGVDKSFLHDALVAAATGRVANMVGPIDRPHQFVFAPDVGPIVLRLALTPQAYGRAWHFAGSGVATQRELLDEIGRQCGKPVRHRVAGKTALRVLGLFNPFLRELVEMHYLLTHPVVMDDAALVELLGPLPRTSYPEGIGLSLAAARKSATVPAL